MAAYIAKYFRDKKNAESIKTQRPKLVEVSVTVPTLAETPVRLGVSKTYRI